MININKILYIFILSFLFIMLYTYNVFSNPICNFLHLQSIKDNVNSNNRDPVLPHLSRGIDIIYRFDSRTPRGLKNLYIDGKKLKFECSSFMETRPSYCILGNGLIVVLKPVKANEWQADPIGLTNIITLEYNNNYQCDVRINKKLYKPLAKNYRKQDGSLDKERHKYDIEMALIYQQGGGLLPSYDEMKRKSRNK